MSIKLNTYSYLNEKAILEKQANEGSAFYQELLDKVGKYLLNYCKENSRHRPKLHEHISNETDLSKLIHDGNTSTLSLSSRVLKLADIIHEAKDNMEERVCEYVLNELKVEATRSLGENGSALSILERLGLSGESVRGLISSSSSTNAPPSVQSEAPTSAAAQMEHIRGIIDAELRV